MVGAVWAFGGDLALMVFLTSTASDLTADADAVNADDDDAAVTADPAAIVALNVP